MCFCGLCFPMWFCFSSRRKPVPMPPGLSLNIPPSNAVPILPLPYNGQYPAPYTHMSEHSDSSDSNHAPPPDPVYVHQMAERIPRQNFTRVYSRGHNASHRSRRGDGPVTHLDNEVSFKLKTFKIILVWKTSLGLISYIDYKIWKTSKSVIFFKVHHSYAFFWEFIF